MVTPKAPTSSASDPFPSWFRKGSPPRTKWFAFWLLVWNSMALADAIMFTFQPAANLDGYLGEGTWCPTTLAMTRMLANCQWGLITTVALVALQGDEAMIRNAFRMLIVTTLGAFRAIYLGVMEGTIRPPFETWWASLLSLPPFGFLLYFAAFF